MVSFEHFSIEWKADGVDLLEQAVFKECIVDFMHRQLPKVSMKVMSVTPENLAKSVDTDLTLVFDDNTTMSMKFFIFKRTVSDNIYTLTGFVGTSDFMKNSRSSYLGDSLDSAIQKVCDVFTPSFTTSISGEFFQFNETNSQCLLRLLKGCSDSKSFEFTNNSIELIDDSEEFELKNGIRTSIEFNFVSDNDSEPIIDSNQDYYNQGWNKKQVYESSSEDYVRNILSTIKYERGYDVLLSCHYQGVPAGIVGGKAKIKFDDLTFDKYTIVGKIIKASSTQDITTDFILGVNK